MILEIDEIVREIQDKHLLLLSRQISRNFSLYFPLRFKKLFKKFFKKSFKHRENENVHERKSISD